MVTGLVVDLGARRRDRDPARQARSRTRRSVARRRLPLARDAALSWTRPDARSRCRRPAPAGRSRRSTIAANRSRCSSTTRRSSPTRSSSRPWRPQRTLAVANAALQAETRARADEIEASRRRIVEAADAQRRRLEQELRLGAERRLDRVAMLAGTTLGTRLLTTDGAAIGLLETRARRGPPRAPRVRTGRAPCRADRGRAHARARASRRALADSRRGRGEDGTASGRRSRRRSSSSARRRWPTLAKHAAASRVLDRPERKGRAASSVAVADDGVGGADPGHGSGLRGLADRVEALGGRLSVESPRGSGTRIVAELPLDR